MAVAPLHIKDTTLSIGPPEPADPVSTAGFLDKRCRMFEMGEQTERLHRPLEWLMTHVAACYLEGPQRHISRGQQEKYGQALIRRVMNRTLCFVFGCAKLDNFGGAEGEHAECLSHGLWAAPANQQFPSMMIRISAMCVPS